MEKRKSDEEEGWGGASEDCGSSGLCVCVFCPCLFIFRRPQRETGRDGESLCRKEKDEREGGTSWWAIMAQFSVFRLYPCTLRCIMIDFIGEPEVGNFGM